MSGGYPKDWGRRRRRVLKRDRYACQSCGKKGGGRGDTELHVHHILPKSKGGGHTVENLTTVCDRCHAEIHEDPRLRTNQKRTGLFSSLFGSRKESKQRRKKRQEGVSRLKREAEKRETTNNSSSEHDYWQQKVDTAYNDTFDGCSSCGRELLTVEWISQGEEKAKIIKCGSCGTLFKERVINTEDGAELALEQIDSPSEARSVPSAFDYELNKHLELGSFDDREMDDLKETLLIEAETREERKRIASKFDQLQSSNSRVIGSQDSHPESKSRDRGSSHDSGGSQTETPSSIVDDLKSTEPRAIRSHIENSSSKDEMMTMLEKMLGDEHRGEITSSLRNDMIRAFFLRVDQDPRNVELLIDSSYEELANKHGEKYALATALNHYLANHDIREGSSIKSLSQSVLASMITAIYIYNSNASS